MLWTGQPLALSVSGWSPCVQQGGWSSLGFPAVGGLSWWQRQTDTEGHREAAALQFSLFIPIHSCFSGLLIQRLTVSHLPHFVSEAAMEASCGCCEISNVCFSLFLALTDVVILKNIFHAVSVRIVLVLRLIQIKVICKYFCFIFLFHVMKRFVKLSVALL